MCARQSKSNRTYLAGRPAGHRKALVEEREGLGRRCGRRHARAWRRRCRAEGCGCWKELARRKSRNVTGKDAIIEDAEHEDTGYPYTHPCGSGGRPIAEVDSNYVSSPRFPSAEPFERGPKKRRAAPVQACPRCSPGETIQVKARSRITTHFDCHPPYKIPHDCTQEFCSKLAIGGIFGFGRAA